MVDGKPKREQSRPHRITTCALMRQVIVISRKDMKSTERPSYIEYARLRASRLGEEGRIRKQIKYDPELHKFWKLGHTTIVPKSFPSRECEIAFNLGQRNAQASDMDE